MLDTIKKTGITYEDFLKLMEETAARPIPADADETTKEKLGYFPLNLRRMKRTYTTFKPTADALTTFEEIKGSQTWMIISEGWCGDTAQNVPVINKLAKLNQNIDVKIILRDTYPEIMDKYLTYGARSIPKLVAFDEEGNELFQWGARPEPIYSIMKEHIAAGLPKHQREEILHTWYAKDGGKSTAGEIVELVKQTTGAEITQ
ncbi:MAG: thioredoxin family protein [Ignavibacteriaceae bacterium]|nr:thioredoxin family protein [Ignavibacteriaceae bacterium]